MTGEVSEWLKEHAWKACVRRKVYRGFESRPLRQLENVFVGSPSARARQPIRTGIEYSTLAKIEGDLVKKPGVQMIAKIARVLGVPMEDLLK